MLIRIYSLILGFFLPLAHAFAIDKKTLLLTDATPEGTIVTAGDLTIISILSIIQGFLLQVVLPIVIVGGSLYIAYELFTADGDETKMKKAWKSFLFTAIGIVCIAVSYAFVSLVSRISF